MSNPIAKINYAVGVVFVGLAFQLCALTVAENSLFNGCARTPSPRTDQVALATEESASEQDGTDIENDDILAALPDSKSSHPTDRDLMRIAHSSYPIENPRHTFRDRSPPVSRI